MTRLTAYSFRAFRDNRKDTFIRKIEQSGIRHGEKLNQYDTRQEGAMSTLIVYLLLVCRGQFRQKENPSIGIYDKRG